MGRGIVHPRFLGGLGVVEGRVAGIALTVPDFIRGRVAKVGSVRLVLGDERGGVFLGLRFDGVLALDFRARSRTGTTAWTGPSSGGRM